MKIAMLNTSDRQGGAAVAASRLKDALNRSGADVTLIVRDKFGEDPDVVSINGTWFRRKLNRFRFLWERLVIYAHNGLSRQDLFSVSIADTGTDFSALPEVREADIIHLHWTNQGFLSLRGLQKLLALGKPVVWTLHDMWAVTGICHHAWECRRYEIECGACPFLDSRKKSDLSTRVFRRKKKTYTPHLNLIPVSYWLKERCESGALTGSLRATVIPNALDTDFFSPGSKEESRQKQDLPAGKKIILMGAARIDDPVKGFSILKEMLSQLNPEIRKNLLLVLFGSIKNREEALEGIPVEVRWLGRVSEPEQLRDLYRSADVTVSSSHYETFGQTLSEAMACGCPAVSFGTSGQPDILDHKKNGYLACYPDTADLAKGVEWVLENSVPAELPVQARSKILSNFTVDKVAGQYLDVYRNLLS